VAAASGDGSAFARSVREYLMQHFEAMVAPSPKQGERAHRPVNGVLLTLLFVPA